MVFPSTTCRFLKHVSLVIRAAVEKCAKTEDGGEQRTGSSCILLWGMDVWETEAEMAEIEVCFEDSDGKTV